MDLENPCKVYRQKILDMLAKVLLENGSESRMINGLYQQVENRSLNIKSGILNSSLVLLFKEGRRFSLFKCEIDPLGE